MFIICVLILIFSFYFLYRNYDAYDFWMGIRTNEKLGNKYTYNQILYSFKPLKFEAWFSEEEVKILNEDRAKKISSMLKSAGQSSGTQKYCPFCGNRIVL